MKKIAWFSGPKLDSVSNIQVMMLCEAIDDANVDAIVINGNIAQPKEFSERISWFDYSNKPLYFVLGPHDYSGQLVQTVREKMSTQYGKNKNCNWLTVTEPVKLSKTTALIGVDGWGDIRIGKKFHTKLLMTEHCRIDDLRQSTNKRDILWKLRSLAEADAKLAKKKLTSALKRFKNVIFMSHIAPYANALLKDEQLPNEHLLPYYVSKCLGDVITDVAKQYTDNNITVLCSPTANNVVYKELDNVTVMTNIKRSNGFESLQRIIEVN